MNATLKTTLNRRQPMFAEGWRLLTCLCCLFVPLPLLAASAQLLGWNNLGMHCMDSDYSVFSILPPYNTIHANLIVGGKLVTNGGYTVTYQAVAAPDGSFNATSRGKGNFINSAFALFGAQLAADQGLPVPGPESFWMPGPDNTPQGMKFENDRRWFAAYGIPITPYDDTGRKNPYPMMRLIARNGSGTPLATNDIVLPVSDEMDCRACHASGSQAAARPVGGWVGNANPERDYRLNILRLHDEKQFAAHTTLYSSALAARGFNAQGLYQGVVVDGKSVLCATCHASEALGTGSYGSIPSLTASVHSKHATVEDPDLHLALDNSANRAACYRCHPGSATKCLRGAMGGAIATDGTMAMQCQSCHGNMSAVGARTRTGWLTEPNCQSCHTGTATSNNGQIRFNTCFEANGAVRVAVNQTFATQPNTPAANFSLYRFSTGHGGLQCSACHGSTHAEFPSTHQNDNLRNERIQGHAGVMVECTACHGSMAITASTAVGGPHGMHPVGDSWANSHGNLIEDNSTLRATCANCHGTAGTGTVLSHMQQSRTLRGKNYWRGQTVSCYDCHNGPGGEGSPSHTPAVTRNTSTTTLGTRPAAMTLPASGAGTMSYRIVSQPAHGAVGLSGSVATYFAEAGYAGVDQFTFAAWNGWVDSNLATGTVYVARAVTQDLNGDGTDDLLWQDSTTTQVGAWLLPTKTWQWISPGNNGTWKIVGMADVNGDGIPDLIWQDAATTQVGSWLMPAKTWQWISPGNNGAWKVVATGDVNGDEKADLVWQNTSTTEVGAWLMPSKAWYWVSPGDNGPWKVVAIADVNGDGTSDVVWQSATGTEVGSWLLPSRSWQWISPGNNGAWKVVGASDVNGDGKADLLWQNSTTTEVGSWLMPSKAWYWVSPGNNGPWRLNGRSP